MPNPSGTNQFQGFSTDLPYGQKQRQDMLQRLAPMPEVSALEAPRRAQKHAFGQAQPQSAPGGPQGGTPPPAPSYGLQVATFWQQYAAETGDPLIHEYAARAQQEVGGV